MKPSLRSDKPTPRFLNLEPTPISAGKRRALTPSTTECVSRHAARSSCRIAQTNTHTHKHTTHSHVNAIWAAYIALDRKRQNYARGEVVGTQWCHCTTQAGSAKYINNVPRLVFLFKIVGIRSYCNRCQKY